MQRDDKGAFTPERLYNHLRALERCSKFQEGYELVAKPIDPYDTHKEWTGYKYYEGRGSYAYVFRCRKKDPQDKAVVKADTADSPAAPERTYSNSELLAVKVILKAPGQAPRPQFSQGSANGGGSVNREIFMLENMTCLFRTRRGSVQLRGQFSTVDAFIIVMTLVTDGVPLKKVIDNLSPFACRGPVLSVPHFERNQVASQFVRDIGLNLFYMHELGLIFGDLSLGNVMQATAKSGKKYFTLVDYGHTTYDGEKMISGRGTIMAPEVSSSLGDPSVHYTTKVDSYVLGALLFSIMTGKEMTTNYVKDVADEVRSTCVSELTALKELEKAESGNKPFYLVNRSPFDLILRLLEEDVEKRWTMKQALGHKWIRQNASTRVDNLGLFLKFDQVFRHPKNPALTYLRYLWEEMAGRATRKTVALEVKSSDTISDIRRKVQYLVGIDTPKLKPTKIESEDAELEDPDPAVQCLFFNGSELTGSSNILGGKQEFVVELRQRDMSPILEECISLYMGVSIQKIKEDTKDLKKVQQFRKLFLERDLGKFGDKAICEIKAMAELAKNVEQSKRGCGDYLFSYLASYMCLKIDQVLDEKEKSAVAGFEQDADALLSALRALTRDRDDRSDERSDPERELELYLLENGGVDESLEESPSTSTSPSPLPSPSLASTPALSRTLSRASITSSASKVDALHDLATLQMESSEDATTTMDSSDQVNAELLGLDLPGCIQSVKDDGDRELDHVMEKIRDLDHEMNQFTRESRRIDAPFGKARSRLHQAAMRLGNSKRGIEKEIREELKLSLALGEGWEKVTSKPKAKGNKKNGCIIESSSSGQVRMLELLGKLKNEIEDLKRQEEQVRSSWENWCRSPAPQAVTIETTGGGRSGGVSGGSREEKTARGAGRGGGGGGAKGRPATGKHM